MPASAAAGGAGPAARADEAPAEEEGGFMKVVINIPCFNEEATLPLVLRELPTSIAGVDSVEKKRSYERA